MTERQVAADQVRRRIAELRDRVAESYYEIGRHLHTVQREALYKLWGFETFSSYVEAEVAFKWRKAMYLMAIYRYYALELSDKQVFELVKSLGVSKAHALIDVINPKNAEVWVEKAKALPVKSLEDEARLAKKAKEERRKQRADSARHREETEAAEQQTDAEGRRGNAVYDKPEGDDEGVGGAAAGAGIHTDLHGGLGADPVPEDERGELRRMFQCLLTGDQRQNIQAAIDCASHLIDDGKSRTQQEKNHDANGYMLDFVATGFLAFHGSTVRENRKKHSATLRRDTLAAFERAFGVRVIAVDADSPNVVYGEGHIDALMGEANEEGS
jgi:hypothetical protein